KSSGYVNKDDQPSSSGSIYDGSEVMMMMSVEALLDWIMDSGGYCWVTIGSERSEVLARVVISGTQRDNCVYSLDGHAVAGELNANVEEKDILAQVKKLRTDNGLEFCNRKFKQLCIESGIARHLTVFGTPQQNRLAE
nr:retrovirus-related Pol polyprotein from transposon TNT 1-94 [Tanacetum cinerariifolium]